MLISAMDNINDNRNSINSNSSETNSVNINPVIESEGVEIENEGAPYSFHTNTNEEIQNHKRMGQEPIYFPGTDIIQGIDMSEINFLKEIGKGSFGVVYKAIWGGQPVAVKKVETETGISALQNEIKQLSRVKHENIIEMYGTASSIHARCIVMEFAYDGSLYQLLHGSRRYKYNLCHALSWLLQCAKAIAYLHAIKPLSIIHRDLKPLNMLLMNGKKVLKICDFGTACDLRSVMTDNKGSTAWMAPEVIKGCKYNEKCDVYSWGMILWELLTRRIPFEELGIPYRILWQVVNKARPPLIQGCPKPIERLMQRCWLDDQAGRPSMQEVVDAIYPLYRILNRGDELISYSSSCDSYTESCMTNLNGESSVDHTSHDVSEFTTHDNTASDLPHIANRSSTSSEGQTTPGNDNQHGQIQCHWGEHIYPPPPQSAISPNASASVLVGVENLLPPWGSAKSDDVITPLALSPSRPPRSKRFPQSAPPDLFTPLSISIPNGGPAERSDLVLATEETYSRWEGGPGGNAAPRYSPWTFPANPPPPPVASPPQVYPSPQVAVSPPRISPPPLTSVATTLTFTPPPPSWDRPHAPLEKASIQVPLRHNPCDPLAALRRRSAEVPQQHRASNVSSRGHRRSSSYESSQLIGFEQLDSEVLQETSRGGQRGLRPPPESGQKRYLHDYTHRGPNRICEEAPPHPKGDVDDPQAPPAGPKYQLASYTSGVGSTPRGIAPSYTPASPRGSTTPVVSPSSTRTKVGVPVSEGSTPPRSSKGSAPPASTEGEELGAFWQLLDDDLKPTMPQPSCPQSQQIFSEHKGLAHQLLVVQEEIVYLDQEKSRLVMKLEEQDREQHACKQRYADKIIQLKSKNESLLHDHSRLSQQLEEIRSRRPKEQPKPSHDPHPQPPPNPASSSPYFAPHQPQGTPPPHQQQQQHPSPRQHLPQQYYYDHHHPQHHHHLYPHMHNH